MHCSSEAYTSVRKMSYFAAHNLYTDIFEIGASKLQMHNSQSSYTTVLLITHNSLSVAKGIVVLIKK